ncbi:MAG: response regulator transcription factor [Clostridiales bacterium]|nr:response regulator transcription factor [Clostridiales bacterium]
MMRIAVCDGEVIITSQIESLLLEIEKKKMISVDIDVFFDGKELTDKIYSGEKYDLIYLDIEMENERDINTARNIRMVDKAVLIICISAQDSCIRKLFEVDTFRLIDKPIDKELFERYFLDAHTKINESAACFTYRFNKEVHNILLENIIYFESQGRKIFVYSRGGRKSCFFGKLNEIEEELKDSKIQFLRTHQSFLVNHIYIKSLLKTCIKLKDGRKIPVSENRKKLVREKYCRLLE